MHPVAYVIMAFGAVLTLIGIALLAKGGAQGTSTAKIFGFELQLAGSSLVVFVVGALIFLVPILFPHKFPPRNDGPPPPPPDRIRDIISGAIDDYYRALDERDVDRVYEHRTKFRGMLIPDLEKRGHPVGELEDMSDEQIIELARKHGLADGQKPKEPGATREAEMRQLLSRQFQEYLKALDEGDADRVHARMTGFRNKLILALFEFREFPAEKLHKMGNEEMIELARKEGLLLE